MAEQQQSSTIHIEELTGDKRVLELNGPALPFQGAAWAGQMRMATKWYVGNNAEATQQVLGPIELPSDWEGKWRTTQMLACPSYFTDKNRQRNAITRASTMRDAIEMIATAGQKLRVTWSTGQTGGVNNPRSLVRVGRIHEWKFPHDRMDDIGWNITFEWMGRGRSTQVAVALRGEDHEASRRDTQQKLADALATAFTDQAVASSQKRMQNSPATSLSLGDLEAFANGPSQMLRSFTRLADSIVNRLKHIGDLAIKLENLPLELANQGLDVANNAVAVANQFVDQITSTPVEYLSMQSKVANLLQAAAYYEAREQDAEKVVDSALTMRDSWRTARVSPADGGGSHAASASVGDIVGTWVTRQGDTYASISSRFYQTSEHGYAIAKANALSLKGYAPELRRAFAIAPPAGVTLVIPNMQVVMSLERA